MELAKKYYYIHYLPRAFCCLDTAYEELEKKRNKKMIEYNHLFSTYEEADTYLSHCCDGGTDMIIGLQIVDKYKIPSGEYVYDIAIDNATNDNKKYERRIIRLFRKKRFEELFIFK